jgi:hypothetical protein
VNRKKFRVNPVGAASARRTTAEARALRVLIRLR